MTQWQPDWSKRFKAMPQRYFWFLCLAVLVIVVIAVVIVLAA